MPIEFSEEDFFEGMSRLRAAIGSIDLRALEVIACHSALERELDLTLDALLPYPEHITKFGFGQKVGVLSATCGHDLVKMIAPSLLAFNQLRNSVAHSDKRKIEGDFKRLCKSFAVNLDPKHTTVVGLATVLTRSLTMVREEGLIG